VLLFNAEGNRVRTIMAGVNNGWLQLGWEPKGILGWASATGQCSKQHTIQHCASSYINGTAKRCSVCV